jgi:hypothetical protein
MEVYKMTKYQKKEKEQKETEQKEGTEQKGQGENQFEVIRKSPKIAFSEQELAAMGLGSAETFKTDRSLGRGIPYVKFSRRIRYLKRDVLEYLAKNRVCPKEK